MKKTENLDAKALEYKPNAVTAIENELILNWYPKRVIDKIGHCGSLLELGIGHGYTARLFNTICEQHVIIEGSQFVIDMFRENNPDFSGQVVSSYFENFSTAQQFDIIVMGFVLEHVDDPAFVLSHFKKFLKPRGRLFIGVPNAKSLNRRIGLELGKIDDIYSLNANDLALGHKRQYCLQTLRDEIEGQGYRIVGEEGIYLKPLPLAVLKMVPDFEDNLQAMMRVGVEFPELCVALLVEATLT